MKNIIIILSIISNFGIAFSASDSDCTPSSEKAEQALTWFLQLDQPNFRIIREKVGLEGTSIEQLRHVENAEECKKLTHFTNKMKDWDVDFSKRDKYYYRTDDFIFVFYASKQIRTGYTPIAIFDKDFNFLGKFAI